MAVEIPGTNLSLDERELEEHFITASGPGGQNVNKVATAVQLRFDAAHSPSLPDYVKARLMVLAGRRMTKDGVLVIDARRFRTQERNRADARQRLAALLADAAKIEAPRIPTKPSKASKRRVKERKAVRSSLKKARAKPALE